MIKLVDSVRDLLSRNDYAYLFSKALGYSSVLGSCFYKLPIIVNILKAGHCGGLSPLALYLETVALLASVVYNHIRGNPFSTYGDIAIIVIQLFLLIFLLFSLGTNAKKEKLSSSHITGVVVFFLTYLYIIMKVVPSHASSNLIILSIISSLISKCPQILRNYQTKQTGVQSIITAGSSILGPLVKIYISLVETKDHYIFLYSLMIFILNFIIFLQILLYRKKSKDE
jgi:mannose-P-dolichol utilization defect protein 1